MRGTLTSFVAKKKEEKDQQNEENFRKDSSTGRFTLEYTHTLTHKILKELN